MHPDKVKKLTPEEREKKLLNCKNELANLQNANLPSLRYREIYLRLIRSIEQLEVEIENDKT